jgi:hypothetical protein
MKWTFDDSKPTNKKELEPVREFYLKYNYKKVRCNHRGSSY